MNKFEEDLIISNKQLNILLAKSPAERVTADYMQNRISKVFFSRLNETVTLCTITIDNGYSVRGESACVNPENYNQEIGEKIAYDNAFRSLWPLFGFLLAETTAIKKRIQSA